MHRIVLFSSVCCITFPRHKERLFSYVIFPLFIALFPPCSPLSPSLFSLSQPPECCKRDGKWCVCACLAAALMERSSRRAQILEWPPLFPHKTASQWSVYIVWIGRGSVFVTSSRLMDKSYAVFLGGLWQRMRWCVSFEGFWSELPPAVSCGFSGCTLKWASGGCSIGAWHRGWVQLDHGNTRSWYNLLSL